MSEPLRQVLRKNVKFHWSSRHQEAFDQLKQALSEPHVLTYFDPKAKTRGVVVDASLVGLGALILQKQFSGDFQPLTFASRALSDVKRRYSQTEREALGIIYACERFRMYLYG